MEGKNKNMNHDNLLDFKVLLAGVGYFLVDIVNNDNFTRIFSFILISGFTLRRWYIMEKRNKTDKDY